MPQLLNSRPFVFFLASLSFACLLGQFCGLWSMHWFGCWVLPPATIMLAWIAFADRRSGANGARQWIVQGAIGGIVAAIAYDLYRLPFVLTGTPLFKVFGRFGHMLIGADGPEWLEQIVGWTYHFSNGAALGIMFLTMVVRPSRQLLLWGAVAWALCVEGILLMTPYTLYFGLEKNAWFIFLTVTAHAIFGIALGLWCCWRVAAR